MTIGADVPLASRIDEGIVQIRLPMTGNPLRYVNGYVLEDDDGLTLVDCGWKLDEVFDALAAGLATFGFALHDIGRLLITHHHFDHYGLAATLRRAGVPELHMHALDWERAAAFAGRHAEADRLSDAWLARNGFVTEPGDGDFFRRWELAEPTHLVEDGQRIGRLEAIWTPGHAPGHLCFYDHRSGRMLTGDHVLDPITPHVGFWFDHAADPLGDYLASLDKVARRPTSGALPAHAEPFADLPKRVAEIVAHTHRRDEQVLAALGAEWASAGDVARALPWRRRERPFAELGAFDREFAVSETISHLEHLRANGLLERNAGVDAIVYRRVPDVSGDPR